jgi:SAM-dependent methyltransferase/uncharacterized protein YbaR (Trm112 family)
MADRIQSLLPLLACPYDGSSLQKNSGAWLGCQNGHRFPVVEDVPVLLRTDVLQTIGIASETLRLSDLHANGPNEESFFIDTLGLSNEERCRVRAVISERRVGIDPVISYLIGATNGMGYKHLIGSLTEYPIPIMPLPTANGEYLLDIGCSWGRWSVAAARKGYSPVGLDPSLGAVLAARRLSDGFGVSFLGVVGDARYLPFKSGVFDVAFSYSVLQHFSKPDARLALRGIKQALRAGGAFLIQMASSWGVRSFHHRALRHFREPVSFEVRYWSPLELKQTFRETFGDVRMSVDCYFGLGLQSSDIGIMPPIKRTVIYIAEVLKSAASWASPLTYAADSLFLEGRTPLGGGDANT